MEAISLKTSPKLPIIVCADISSLSWNHKSELESRAMEALQMGSLI